jgi:hypothetical protein
LADQAILLQLTTSAKDLHIVLEATDSEEDYVASNLMPLCNSPSVRGLILYAEQQQEHLCISHSWKRFSLLRSLDLTDVFLDDSCITALNCLTLLEALGIVIKSTNRVHKPLTRAIMLPLLRDLYVCVNDYMAADQDVHGADALLLPDNLLTLLRTPQLNSIFLDGSVVSAQTFLQLQLRSPLLELQECYLAMLVEDLQLAAVAKTCPQLLAAGRCGFGGITHNGIASTALTNGRSLTALCGAGIE